MPWEAVEPACRHQTREVEVGELVERVRLADPSAAPRVVLAVSPCRTGSTSLVRLFAASGIESHMQPIKIVLRWRMLGGEASWSLPAGGRETVFVKETLGPYTEAESRLDPVAVLLAAGLPAARLHLLIMGREPAATWASWQRWWGGETRPRLLVDAFETTEAIRRRAGALGVPVTCLVFEALRDHRPGEIASRLGARLGVDLPARAARDWHRLPPFAAPDSGIVWQPMPEPFVVPGIHDRLLVSRGWGYYARTEPAALPHAGHEHRPEAPRARAIFAAWRAACEADLGIRIATAGAPSGGGTGAPAM